MGQLLIERSLPQSRSADRSSRFLRGFELSETTVFTVHDEFQSRVRETAI